MSKNWNSKRDHVDFMESDLTPQKPRRSKSTIKKTYEEEQRVPKFNQNKKSKRVKLRDHQWEIWE